MVANQWGVQLVASKARGLSEYELFLSPRIEAPSLQLEVQVQIEVQETSINCQLIANQFQH
jgi:hypothetical protein